MSSPSLGKPFPFLSKPLPSVSNSIPSLSKRYLNVVTALVIVVVFYFYYSETQAAHDESYAPHSQSTSVRLAVTDPEPQLTENPKDTLDRIMEEQKAFCRVLPQFTSASSVTRDIALRGRSFKMSYFKENDIVSNSIKALGTWEAPVVDRVLDKLLLVSQTRGADKAIFIDVGANIGWYSLAIASQGYQVIAFEPMPQNEALFRRSLCLNPEINDRVRYHALGLGMTTEVCDMWSHDINVGDGHAACGSRFIPGVTDNKEYSFRATINVEKLDDIMGTTHLDDIGVIKMDIEGFEGNVFNGASTWLKQAQPPFIVTELVPFLIVQKSLSPLELLKTIDSLGYDIRKDSWEGTLVPPSQFAKYVAQVRMEEIYLTSRKWKTA